MTLCDTDRDGYDPADYPRPGRIRHGSTLDNRTSRYGDDTDGMDEDDAPPTDNEGGE